MTYTFEKYDRNLLDRAVKNGHSVTFSLGTDDIGELGISHPHDVALVRVGDWFDLHAWQTKPIRRLMLETPKSPREILDSASGLVGYLYLQYEQAGGPAGMGDISATYNPLVAPTSRVVQLDPIVA